MKNHFYIPYAGNKWYEMEHIKFYINDIINKNNIKYIIEPFCGSAAFSYYCSLLYPKKFKYILNDNNNELIKFLNNMKDDNKRNEIQNSINKIIVTIKNKNDYDNLQGLHKWFIHNYIYFHKPGKYPSNKKFNNIKINFNKVLFTNFILNEDIEFINNNGIDIINKYSINNNVLLFIDPPYLKSYNKYYSTDSSEYIFNWFNNNDINNFKCKVIMILEYIDSIYNLFFNNIIDIYDKKYLTYKNKKTTHCIIIN